MLREIVLDTETTGLNHQDGHRVVEIGCVELINHIPTKKTYHTYINPERDVPMAASAVSGITTEFLKPYPIFSFIVEDFIDFIGEDVLVIHNASFDLGFLNAEFKRLNKKPIPLSRGIDTVALARKKFPGSPANLDALCKRFGIDLSVREKHGALVDAHLLAKVYLELLGGRQRSLELERHASIKIDDKALRAKNTYPYRQFHLEAEEKKLHEEFLKSFNNPLWKKFEQVNGNE